MMGERRVMQEALFYGFSLERHVPDNHLLRRIDRFVDLSEVRTHLEPYYSKTGRPSIDPELMIRMLIVGYGFGIRSERRLCDDVRLNLAYRWFCRLGLDGEVPEHSTFSKNRHGRFRESDLLRKLFETVVACCMKEGVVGGEAFAVDASIIVADAHRRRSVAKVEDLVPTSSRAVAEYLSVLDDAAFSGATPVEPKVISPTDPAARYTASANSVAGYAYSDKLSHRSEACGDHGHRSDDGHSSGGSRRRQDDARPYARPSPYVRCYMLIRIDDPRAGRELLKRLIPALAPATDPAHAGQEGLKP
jgi:transposase